MKTNLKRDKQSQYRHLINRSQLSAVKTQIKKTQRNQSEQELKKAYRMIDSLCAKGIIHQNKANRLKSRLTINLNKMAAQTDANSVPTTTTSGSDVKTTSASVSTSKTPAKAAKPVASSKKKPAKKPSAKTATAQKKSTTSKKK